MASRPARNCQESSRVADGANSEAPSAIHQSVLAGQQLLTGPASLTHLWHGGRYTSATFPSLPRWLMTSSPFQFFDASFCSLPLITVLLDTLAAAVDGTGLLAGVAAGDMLAFRALQFPAAFVAANPAIFLTLDWVHPGQLRAFLADRDRSGVTSFKSYVTLDVLKRLMDFPYMKTDEELEEFTAWIGSLNIKKVQDWWKHKLRDPWIPPSLIKSRSRIHAADWDITDASTSLNEGQHHWTNQQTGVKLTILEAI
ncbi:hypothetical protein DFH08DRAFT_955640 [Mycena albidolilacea]|uniref:Uncharacterized protein n=1 Tax=Mycena albidolilacea TaxID=1033008 RepID=A0AAD7ABI2_9AGAR|nr:hypothetical protein DFH08DRAFT_955640 [Mycena albidolilacea]